MSKTDKEKTNDAPAASTESAKIKELDEYIASLEKANEELVVENNTLTAKIKELEEKVAPTSSQDKLIAACNKKGKGLYAMDSFRDGGQPYAPGDKIDPDKLTGDKSKLINKGLIFEVK